MAAWSSIIWGDFAHLIEKGTTGCDIPRNPLYVRCNPKKHQRTKDIYRSFINRTRKVSLIHWKNVNKKDIKISHTIHGVYFDIKGKTADRLRAKEEKVPVQKDKNHKPVKYDFGASESMLLSTKNKYAKLGW